MTSPRSSSSSSSSSTSSSKSSDDYGSKKVISMSERDLRKEFQDAIQFWANKSIQHTARKRIVDYNEDPRQDDKLLIPNDHGILSDEDDDNIAEFEVLRRKIIKRKWDAEGSSVSSVSSRKKPRVETAVDPEEEATVVDEFVNPEL